MNRVERYLLRRRQRRYWILVISIFFMLFISGFLLADYNINWITTGRGHISVFSVKREEKAVDINFLGNNSKIKLDFLNSLFKNK